MKGHWEELADIVFLDKNTGAKTTCVISRHLTSDWKYLRMAEDRVPPDGGEGSDVQDVRPPTSRAGEGGPPAQEFSEEFQSDIPLMRALGLPLTFTNKPPPDDETWVATAQLPPPSPPAPPAGSPPQAAGSAPSSPADSCLTSPPSVTSSEGDWLQCTYGGGQGTPGLQWTVCEEDIPEECEERDLTKSGESSPVECEPGGVGEAEHRGSGQDGWWQQWEQHWAAWGEQTVLRTWTEKYRDFIDPEYLNDTEADNAVSTEPAASPETHCQQTTDESTLSQRDQEVSSGEPPVGGPTDDRASAADTELRSWDELWQLHYQQVYDQMLAEFTVTAGQQGEDGCDASGGGSADATRGSPQRDAGNRTHGSDTVVSDEDGSSRLQDAAGGRAAATADVSSQARADRTIQSAGDEIDPDAMSSAPKKQQKKKKSRMPSRKSKEMRVQSVGALLAQLQDGRLSPVDGLAEYAGAAVQSSQPSPPRSRPSSARRAARDSRQPGTDDHVTTPAGVTAGIEGLRSDADHEERRCDGGVTGGGDGGGTEEDSAENDLDTKDPLERGPGDLRWAEGALTMLGFCHSANGADLTPQTAHVRYKQKRLKQKTRALNMTKTAFTDEDVAKQRLPVHCSEAERTNASRMAGSVETDPTDDAPASEVNDGEPAAIGDVIDDAPASEVTDGGSAVGDVTDDPSVPEELRHSPQLAKYWHQRYRLFSRFDSGVRLSGAAWFSVTPEQIARHLADRCRRPLIVDAFCGAGGNAIQFARTCGRVVAVDLDRQQLELARHNASIYGVADRIEFVLADFFTVAERLRADAVFLSPPWGGPRYCQEEVYDMYRLDGSMDGRRLMQTARRISPNVALLAPRNANTHQLVALAGAGGRVELEQNLLNGKIKTITAYYGDLATTSS